jgi:hypothetical protein
MDFLKALELTSFLLTVLGMIYIIYVRKIGFVFYNIAAIMQFILFFHTEMYFLVFQTIGYMIFNTWGYLKWRKEKKIVKTNICTTVSHTFKIPGVVDVRISKTI